MKTKLFIGVLSCILFSALSYGQVREFFPYTPPSQEKAQQGLKKDATALTGTTGDQNLVILFVDFPDGRKPDGTLPTVDADTSYFPTNTQINAVGGMGWEWIDPNNHNLGQRKKIRKYTYDDYWDMFFSQTTYYGVVHPDYVSHSIQAYGSFKEYYAEVSYSNLTIVPFQTWSGSQDKYHTGIINAFDEANGKKYVRWIKMPNNKSSYNFDGYQILTPDKDLFDGILRNAFNNGEINFNIDNYNGRILIVGAGGWDGAAENTVFPNYMTFNEKRDFNYNRNTSTLNGIQTAIHEFEVYPIL